MTSELTYDGGLTCALEVTDLDRSISWYVETLGARLLYRLDDIGWCELTTHIDGVRLGLSQVEQVAGRGGATLTFGVTNIEEARQRLEKREVRFDGPTQTIEGMVKLATFYDPDDNALMLYEDLSLYQDTTKA